jgi:predicted outer membrane repeat protein
LREIEWSAEVVLNPCRKSRQVGDFLCRTVALAPQEIDCLKDRSRATQVATQVRRIHHMERNTKARGGQGGRRSMKVALLICGCFAAASFAHGVWTTRTSANPDLLTSTETAIASESVHGTLRVPAEYGDLQSAIDAAATGTTVLVAPGVYKGNWTIRNKWIVLRGEGDAANPGAWLQSERGDKPVLTIEGLAACGTEIDNLLLFGASGTQGVGMLVDRADITARRCAFNGNEGGGVAHRSGKSEYFSCLFERNGADFAGGGLRNDAGNLTLVGCVVRGNNARTFGGGIYSSNGTLTLVEVTISGNTTRSGAWGGGIYSAESSLLALDASIERNASAGSGGGVFVAGGDASLHACRFTANRSADAWSVDARDAKVQLETSMVCGDNLSPNLGASISRSGVTFLGECFPDRNRNGIDDAQEIASGSESDCDRNGVPDSADPDCNENGLVDACEIAAGWVRDCNGNGIPDRCEILRGLAADRDGDGVLDECESVAE